MKEQDSTSGHQLARSGDHHPRHDFWKGEFGVCFSSVFGRLSAGRNSSCRAAGGRVFSEQNQQISKRTNRNRTTSSPVSRYDAVVAALEQKRRNRQKMTACILLYQAFCSSPPDRPIFVETTPSPPSRRHQGQSNTD
jgi:hypothetical protein